jgi:hypothetical protein
MPRSGGYRLYAVYGLVRVGTVGALFGLRKGVMRRIGLAVCAVAVAAAVVTGCGGGEDSTAGSGSSSSAAAKGAAKAEAPAATKDMKITRSGFEDHQTWGDHAFVTHYEITNHGKGAADYFVQLEYLDVDGDVLGSTGVTAEKLGEGKTNKGDTAPVESEIRNGKMSDIKGVRVLKVERTDPV